MASVLVSGMAGQVAAVAAALRGRGAEVTEVTDLAEVPAACAAAGAAAFDTYVQLPATFQIQGDTAILRVHHFYADGVLARFPALAAALPSLRAEATLTFVLGTLPPDVATSADRDARQALTRVLAHAAMADHTGELTVQILDADRSTPDEIAQVALGLDPSRQRLLERLDDLSYADWRVEVLGLVAVET